MSVTVTSGFSLTGTVIVWFESTACPNTEPLVLVPSDGFIRYAELELIRSANQQCRQLDAEGSTCQHSHFSLCFVCE